MKIKKFIKSKMTVKNATTFVTVAGCLLLMGMIYIDPIYAKEASSTIQDFLKKFVSTIGLCFQAVGVILAFYSTGQLILAFKDDNAGNKSSAAMQLAVAAALIAVPQIIKSLNLIELVTGKA